MSGEKVKSNYLVTARFSMGDDVELFGFNFLEQEQVKDFKKLLKSIHREFSLDPAPSITLEFQDGEECLECIDFVKIKSEDDYKVLYKYFGDGDGLFSPRVIMEQLEGEDFSDDGDYEEEEQEQEDF